MELIWFPIVFSDCECTQRGSIGRDAVNIGLLSYLAVRCGRSVGQYVCGWFLQLPRNVSVFRSSVDCYIFCCL
jgi:hypothetical protein